MLDIRLVSTHLSLDLLHLECLSTELALPALLSQGVVALPELVSVHEIAEYKSKAIYLSPKQDIDPEVFHFTQN